MNPFGCVTDLFGCMMNPFGCMADPFGCVTDPVYFALLYIKKQQKTLFLPGDQKELSIHI